jgi:hypothetical protein
MTHAEDRPLPAVGVYWIKEDDYPALLTIFDDGNKMPPTWSEWLKMAEEMGRGLKAYGHHSDCVISPRYEQPPAGVNRDPVAIHFRGRTG